MLKKLLGRHRMVRLGATIVGASALAVGFASPAFAAGSQNVNNGGSNDSPAQNYLIVQGGSNTAYYLMQAEADIFNQAPGCDLAGLSSAVQPLDYGCPGLAPETQGAAQTAASTTGGVFTGQSVTVADKNIILTGSGNTTASLVAGDEVYDSAGAIPVGDPILAVKNTTKFKVQFKPTKTVTADTITVVTTPQNGENGFTNWGQQNPFNDVLVEEPSYGSSNGILELEGTGNSTTPGKTITTNSVSGAHVSPIDSARSSRAPKLTSSGDYQGLNFVAYAEDAVSYLSWSKYNGATTDAEKCLASIGNNPSTTQLKTVFNETYTGSTPNVTWASAFGCTTAGSSNPVYAYWAQNGSGTESTWASATGAAFAGASPSTWPAKNIIFENETASILGNAAKAPVGDAMFFFSYGKFNKVCTPAAGTETSSTALCAGTSTAAGAPNQVTLGTEEGTVPLTETTINNELPGQTGSAYFGDRLLYNVYSNGFNPNIPASSNATLNAISEDGFMCKPSTAWDVDPNTGLTYKTEIETAIENQGFFPLPALQVEDGQGDTSTPTGVNPGYSTTAAGIPHPAWTLGATLGTAGLSASNYNASNESTWSPVNQDDDNSAIQGAYTADVEGVATPVTASVTNPVGYCLTLSTDGSSAGQ